MRRYRLRPAVFSLLLACGPAEPGGSDTEAAGGGTTGTAPTECPAEIEPLPDPDAYAAALAEAICAEFVACDCSDVPDTCVADQTAALTARNAAYLAAGSVFDPVCARKTVLRQEGSSCDAGAPSPCSGCAVFVGTRAEGEACEVIEDTIDPCGPGLLCNGGRCAPGLPTVGEGAKCRDDGTLVALCGPDRLCDFDQDICVPMPVAGDPCRDGYCGIDLWCDASDSPTGVCRAQRPGGDPCNSPLQCESLVCVQSRCSDDPRYCLLNL